MTQLWTHQQQAVDFAMGCREQRRHGTLLAMGMGTGKSACALEVANRTGARRMLIVGPKAVVSQNAWGSQFMQHGGGRFRYALLNKGNGQVKVREAQRTLSQATAHGRVCALVVNYESLWREPLASWVTGEFKPDLLVLDESHRIKSPRGKASRFVSEKLATGVRRRDGFTLELTGTPMPHSPLDTWAQFRAIDPEVLGPSFVRFRSRYAVMGGYENRQVLRFQRLDELQERMAPFTFRVSSDVLEFDEPIVATVQVALPPDVRRAYKSMEDDLVAQLEIGEVTAANGLVKLLRLQQFTSGAARVDDTEEVQVIHTAKEDALLEVLEDSMQEPVVVFGQFNHDQDVTHRAAERCGVTRPSFELSGRVNELETWDQMSRAGVTPAPVLAVQIASGGTGINLTAAGLGVYLSTGFNMGQFDQSLARLNRPGRQPLVRFLHIEAADSIDTRVRAVLRSRANLVDGVLNALQGTTTNA